MLSHIQLLQAKRTRCLNRLWKRGGCIEDACLICHYDTEIHRLWEDTGNATVLIVLVDEFLPNSCFVRFYIPYIRRLERTQLRNYLIYNSSNWKQVQAWIVEMTCVKEDHIQEYQTSSAQQPQDMIESIDHQHLVIPYNAESAILSLSIHAENPSILFVRQDELIRNALGVKKRSCMPCI